jgi:hypothetical protein
MGSANDQLQTYMNGTPTILTGSFLTGTPPTIFRDGHAFAIKSVTRVSAGLFEVTFDDGFPIPELPVFHVVKCTAASATPTLVCEASVVEGTYSQSTRKFRIVVVKAGNTGSGVYVQPAVADPDAGSRINFLLIGSVNSAGTDIA